MRVILLDIHQSLFLYRNAKTSFAAHEHAFAYMPMKALPYKDKHHTILLSSRS